MEINYLKIDEKGFTLIEVLVALTLLIIIAFAFIPLFSSSFFNIFTYGHRDKAVAQSSEYLEVINANSTYASKAAVIEDLDDMGGYSIEPSGDSLSDHQPGYSFNYHIEENIEPYAGVTGFKVSVSVFYRAGDRHVTLTTFVREE